MIIGLPLWVEILQSYISADHIRRAELNADRNKVKVVQAPSSNTCVNPDYFGVQGVGGSRSTMGY